MNLRFGLDLTDLTSKEELSDQIVTFTHYKDLPLFPKKLLTSNILEAHGQYDLRSVVMPDDFYDFLASHDSDELFFPDGLL